MVGIAGFMLREGENREGRNLLESMIETLQYTKKEKIDRWNDDVFFISRVHHGVINAEQQPALSEDGNLCAFMFGEVFGHDKEGGESDAEFCLRSYEDIGDKAFEKLNGSFTIAIYNKKTNSAKLVSDRFSSNPVFYFHDKNGFFFGSYVHTLLECHQVPRRLDIQSIMEFLTFQHLLMDHTFHKDIKMLMPASIMNFGFGGKGGISVSCDRYWKPKFKNKKMPEQYYADALAKAIENAIKIRSEDNLRYGISLSGGYDSRALLGAFDRSKNLTACTYGSPLYTDADVRVGKKLAHISGIKWYLIPHSENGEMLSDRVLDDAVNIGNGMYRVDNTPMREYVENVEGIDVMFHGLGFDCTFQGSLLPAKTLSLLGKSFPLPLLERVKTGDIPQRALEVRSTISKNIELVFNPPYREKYKKWTADFKDSVTKLIQEKQESIGDPLNAIVYFHVYPLSKMGVYLNHMALSAYKDSRPVLLDNNLWDVYLEMPATELKNMKAYRKAIKKLSPELSRVENSNTGFRLDISPESEWLLRFGKYIFDRIGRLLKKPKKGGLSAYIRETDRLRNILWETIHDRECINPEIFDIKHLERIFQEHMDDKKDHYCTLMLILTFGLWHKRYGK